MARSRYAYWRVTEKSCLLSFHAYLRPFKLVRRYCCFSVFETERLSVPAPVHIDDIESVATEDILPALARFRQMTFVEQEEEQGRGDRAMVRRLYFPLGEEATLLQYDKLLPS